MLPAHRGEEQSHQLHRRTASQATQPLPWLQDNIRKFHLADETRSWFGFPGPPVSFTHLSLSLLKRGGLAASQLSHLEGRELRCYEAPNQRGATSCLQGARSFKFPDESLQQCKSFRIWEYGSMKNSKALKRELNRSQWQMRWGKKGRKRSLILWIVEMSWLISASLNLNYIMDSLSNETPNVLKL